MIRQLNYEHFERVCGWFTSLPNYMFAAPLSARLIDFAYGKADLQKVDRAVRAILVYQGSLEEPIAAAEFVDLCEQLYADTVPAHIAEFLQREQIH